MFSWFKKKQHPSPAPKVDMSHLPALNTWDIFFQSKGFNLYSRGAGVMPGRDSERIYLKSYPEVAQLERAQYADWLFIAFAGEFEGVFLQRMDADGVTLIFIRFNDQDVRVVKTGLKTVHSAVFSDSATVTFTSTGKSFSVNAGL